MKSDNCTAIPRTRKLFTIQNESSSKIMMIAKDAARYLQKRLQSFMRNEEQLCNCVYHKQRRKFLSNINDDEFLEAGECFIAPQGNRVFIHHLIHKTPSHHSFIDKNEKSSSEHHDWWCPKGRFYDGHWIESRNLRNQFLINNLFSSFALRHIGVPRMSRDPFNEEIISRPFSGLLIIWLILCVSSSILAFIVLYRKDDIPSIEQLNQLG